MTKKKLSKIDRLTRKAVRVGAALGAFLMPVAFYLVSNGSDMTDHQLMWLAINGVSVGVLVGGGLGYLLTSPYL